MTARRSTTRSRSASATRATAARHELDEVLIDQSKTKMKGSAAPLLGKINQLEKAAIRNIEKREAFLKTVASLKSQVRDGYDDGDESAIAKVAKLVAAYENSLLRPSRRSK